MTSTAKALATGPFHGFFHEGATLYRLDPPVVAGGPTKQGIQSTELRHVIVSALDADDAGNPPETIVFAADENGVVDSKFYLMFGAVLEMHGTNDQCKALVKLGYGEVR
ncbi:MAG TPA: hypothetical protein VJ617_00050 [Arthrobacter sp.]|nr:hypothetical protein [Arthrobacter sp.]